MTLKPTHQLLFYFQNLLKSNKLEFLKDTSLNNMKEMYGNLVEHVDTNNGVIKFWKVFSDQHSNGEPTEGLVTYDFYKEHKNELIFNAKVVTEEIDKLVYSKAEANEVYTATLKNISLELHSLNQKADKLYPNYPELPRALKLIEHHLLIKYDIKPFAKKRAEDKLSYFGFKDTISRQKFIELYELADSLEIIEYDVIDQETFLEVLLENPSEPNKVIKFFCQNALAKQFIEKLRPYFTSLDPKSIEKSGRFLTKGGTVLSETNYNRTLLKFNPKLDRLNKEMDTILLS
ncbi:DUF6617 family protein [Winogradskyella helgolandensis]|uniref:DUF6617 family protein n=1 Tax=Winogradskyella helgolandensis TaxID=2697010 RepID=UPI0015CC8037|nr:DUF6617 family protein [Winogradskyella helgolandensis]